MLAKLKNHAGKAAAIAGAAVVMTGCSDANKMKELEGRTSALEGKVEQVSTNLNNLHMNMENGFRVLQDGISTIVSNNSVGLNQLEQRMNANNAQLAGAISNLNGKLDTHTAQTAAGLSGLSNLVVNSVRPVVHTGNPALQQVAGVVTLAGTTGQAQAGAITPIAPILGKREYAYQVVFQDATAPAGQIICKFSGALLWKDYTISYHPCFAPADYRVTVDTKYAPTVLAFRSRAHREGRRTDNKGFDITNPHSREEKDMLHMIERLEIQDQTVRFGRPVRFAPNPTR